MVKSGSLIIELKYDYIVLFWFRVGLVKNNGKFGVVNYDGEEVVMFVFDWIVLEDRKVKVYVKKGIGVVDEVLIIFEFDKDGCLLDNSNFSNYFMVKIKVKVGLEFFG